MKCKERVRIHTIWTIFLLLIIPYSVYSQSQIRITRPQLELLDNELIIGYDILNSQPMDVFKVWIEVTDASGNIILANALSGDIGNEIKGGTNKRIFWNFKKDDIFLKSEIFVEVIVEKRKPEVIETEGITTESEISYSTKSISKTNMLLSSVVFPGWGLSKIKKNKTYMILGVAGYGCLAGSVYLNRTAINSYDEYKTSLDVNESNTLYDKSVSQNNTSKILGYSAAGIWVINIIWTLVSPVTPLELSDNHRFNNINIQPGYSQHLNCTTVSLYYKF